MYIGPTHVRTYLTTVSLKYRTKLSFFSTSITIILSILKQDVIGKQSLGTGRLSRIKSPANWNPGQTADRLHLVYISESGLL